MASSAVWLGPHLSLAQDASLAPNLDATGSLGDATFAQGLRALDEHDFASAEALFSEALERDNQDRYRFNLAVALIRQGKFVQATAVLRPLVLNAQGDPLFGEAASELEREARDQIGTIVVEGRRAEVSGIRLGERPHTLGEARLGLSVDPGVLEFAAIDDDGDTVYSTLVDVGAGALVTVSLTDSDAPDAPLAPAGEDEDEAESVFEAWWFWTAIGGTVLAAALTTWLVVELTGSPSSDGNLPPVFVGESP